MSDNGEHMAAIANKILQVLQDDDAWEAGLAALSVGVMLTHDTCDSERMHELLEIMRQEWQTVIGESDSDEGSVPVGHIIRVKPEWERN